MEWKQGKGGQSEAATEKEAQTQRPTTTRIPMGQVAKDGMDTLSVHLFEGEAYAISIILIFYVLKHI